MFSGFGKTDRDGDVPETAALKIKINIPGDLNPPIAANPDSSSAVECRAAHPPLALEEWPLALPPHQPAETLTAIEILLQDRKKHVQAVTQLKEGLVSEPVAEADAQTPSWPTRAPIDSETEAKARMIYVFEGQAENELSVHREEMVVVVKKEPSGQSTP